MKINWQYLLIDTIGRFMAVSFANFIVLKRLRTPFVVRKVSRRQSPWLTHDLKLELRHRDVIYKRARRTNDQSLLERTTPDKVTRRSMFSLIHFLVSAVTLRGPWEAETSWPPILAKRYSEKRADDFSSISRFPMRSRFEKTPEADDGDGDDGRDDAEGIPVPETGDTPAAVPAGDDGTDDTLRDFSAEPQQHHHEDDDGLPFWGC
ncbi:hypothetical protein KQX54_014445 [Cotesia glomerata]|uniref:Uncharacterized protein n=1 Tax=Cotesia glomerata TaxID=32391 RepID=A0AAV7ILW1_COTGL|nr:hypothetical protein KQX54_014445 [Cotesia glomerata]